MKKLLSFLILALVVSFTAAAETANLSASDFNWLSAASKMIRKGETVRTPSRDRVTLLVKWARLNDVKLTLVNPASTGASYSVSAK